MNATNVLEEEQDVNAVHYVEDGDAPDEAEINLEPEEKEEPENKLEVVVEDDTPEEDRNRTPLDDEARASLEEDMDNVSKGVKDRISKLTRAMHDERRAKEAAERQSAELVQNVQYYRGEVVQANQRYAQGYDWAVEQAKERAILANQFAEGEYKKAVEEGDVDAQTVAQRQMNEAQTYAQQVAQMQAQRMAQAQQQQPLAQQPQQAYTQPVQQARPQAVDKRAQAWAEKNSEWFGKDTKMTSYALGVHTELVEELGIDPSSDEYYKEIEKELADKFPSKFGSRQPSTVVTSSGRAPQGRKVVLTRSEVEVARDLGITPAEYAAEKIRMGRA